MAGRLLPPVVDARVLAWMLVWVFATGVPLMMWFDTDPAVHAARLPQRVGVALRALHAATTVLLVWGTLAHLLLRLRATHAPRRAVTTGALALLSVAFATLTGALIAQTSDAKRLLALAGLDHVADAVLWSSIAHIAYATILVLLTLYFHIAKWGWRRVLGRPVQALLALAAAAALAALLGGTMPGEAAGWQGTTWLVAPPVQVLWLWTVLLAGAILLARRRLAPPAR